MISKNDFMQCYKRLIKFGSPSSTILFLHRLVYKCLQRLSHFMPIIKSKFVKY